MSMKENKAIVQRWIDAINNRDLDILDELIAHDFIYHTHNIQGLDVIKPAIASEIQGFPDFHVTLKDIVAVKDIVWIYVEETGTHTGEFRGVAPTGKKTQYSEMAIFRIKDGKVTEGWGVYDYLDYYQQLNVITYHGFPYEQATRARYEDNRSVIQICTIV
jgi:steroid delta-isomerase-like uncharacterized protein